MLQKSAHFDDFFKIKICKSYQFSLVSDISLQFLWHTISMFVQKYYFLMSLTILAAHFLIFCLKKKMYFYNTHQLQLSWKTKKKEKNFKALNNINNFHLFSFFLWFIVQTKHIHNFSVLDNLTLLIFFFAVYNLIVYYFQLFIGLKHLKLKKKTMASTVLEDKWFWLFESSFITAENLFFTFVFPYSKIFILCCINVSSGTPGIISYLSEKHLKINFQWGVCGLCETNIQLDLFFGS